MLKGLGGSVVVTIVLARGKGYMPSLAKKEEDLSQRTQSSQRKKIFKIEHVSSREDRSRRGTDYAPDHG
jgi:hypothetical protein